jgi:hypothetical protein
MPSKTETREIMNEYEHEGYDPTRLDGGVKHEDPRDDVEVRLERIVQRAAEQAIQFREEDLDADQAKATDYYNGKPFGNEAEGRSRVVSTDVRDTVQAMLPSLMRIFFGGEKAVEYEPRGPDDVELAEQFTDIAEVVVRSDNDGFAQIHGAMKDAMVRKLGVLKVWWEEKEAEDGYEYTGLTEQALASLEQDREVEVEITSTQYEPSPLSPTGFIETYDARAVRTYTEGRCRFACVPPEEFFFSPEARDRDSAEMLAHLRPVPASELIAMGIDKDLVDKHKGRVRHTQTGDDLEAARRFDGEQREQLLDERDESRDECWFGEVYIEADMSEEQDGTTSLLKVRVIGDNHEVVDWYECRHKPFALFTCDPEPHTLIGLSIADYVMDIQLIKSSVLRGMLDSLTLSLNPRTVAVEDDVNIADLLNHEVGGVVRVERDPNSVKEFVHRFDQSGASAFPMLAYLDEQKENRTGISKAAAGLDADALQSSTKAAVAATLSGAQQHIEMLARIFAETGFRQLYELILDTLVENQDQPRTMKLRNEWVEVDPRDWHTNLDVRINIALGAGGTEEKLQLLDMISNHQKQLLDEGSPLGSRVKYRSALGRMVELAGFPNAEEFYPPWTEKQEQEYQQRMSQQPPSDPTMLAVENEFKIQQAKLQLDREEMIMKDARESAKIQLDYSVKQATAEAQYGAQIDNQELMADQAMAKAVIEAGAKEAIARQQGGPTNATQAPTSQAGN